MSRPSFFPWFLFSLLLSLQACTTKTEQVSCANRDWYELGRKDGLHGRTLETLASYEKECGMKFTEDLETEYLNGRNAGLVDFCEPSSGFEMGRMGMPYFYVCPSTVESEFLVSYRKGQSARELELKNLELDSQINTLSERLIVAPSTYERNQLKAEIELLRRMRAQNEQAIKQNSF